ncbi:MAG: DNRLRE domain-containing protein [Verrucomicrobiales bacterium]|nr:DNRLRE domain-containing protein [Verrucomicrobiales bacterium]
MRCFWSHFLLPVLTGSVLSCASAAPPRYDHVVIVVEENRTAGQIVGDTINAPYITSLAAGGVSIGRMFAHEHPSQPNYLQLFSGANQGVVDDELPPNFSTTSTSTYPFVSLNLGRELLDAGFTFAGFSEDLEMAGAADWADFDPHSATYPGVKYRRKHNPWANWVAKESPLPANQLPPSINRAFTQFPANFAQLPTVSFVIPDQDHDMHDGSRREGDDWLRDHLDAYAQWAKTHNSLLVITWDEDDYDETNQIPTVLHGAGLRTGTVTAGTWTLHNLLRTLEDMYGVATHAGAAGQVRSIIGPFTADPAVTTLTFRQGLNGYTGARDTMLWEETPDASHAATVELTADLDTTSSVSGNQTGQVLVRFDNLFGAAAGQIPAGSIIRSAKLILFTPSGSSSDSDSTYRAHRMIADWTDAATWNSMSGGVSNNNSEAASSASFSLVPDVDGGPAIFDVTADMELFQSGTPNRGWLLRASSTDPEDGWTMNSSEFTTDVTQRPVLEVTFTPPAAGNAYSTWAAAAGLTAANHAPDADPDGDGAENLLEFAFNMIPLAADAVQMAPAGTAGLPFGSMVGIAGGRTLEMTFLRRKAPGGTGLSCAAQFSPDLQTWSGGLPPVVTSLNAEWERVKVRDSAAANQPRRFGRVLVSFTP